MTTRSDVKESEANPNPVDKTWVEVEEFAEEIIILGKNFQNIP